MFTVSRLLKSAAALALGLALTHTSAKADTYDLTLIPFPFSGIEGGTGTLTVTGPVSKTGLFDFDTLLTGAEHETTLDVTIDGMNFTLSDTALPSGGSFFDGDLVSLIYNGQIGNYNLSIYDGLFGSVLYSFTETRVVTNRPGNFAALPSVNTTGYITAVVTPEPVSVALFGTLLVVLWIPLRKMLARRA